MLLLQPVHVAKLLVRHHFVPVHHFILALMLQSHKHFDSLVKIFEVHADAAIALKCPIQAVELTLLRLFDKVTERFHDRKNGQFLLFPGGVLV